MTTPLRSRTTTTKWSLFFHNASIGLSIISGVVLVPMYLKFIPVDLYGAWVATGNILVWITIIDPGLSPVLLQQVGVAYGKNDKETIQNLIVSGNLITLCIVVLVIAMAIAATPFIPSWLNLSGEIDIVSLKKAFIFAALGSGLMILSFTFTSINQGLQASLGIGLIFVAVSVLRICIVIILLYQGFCLIALGVSHLVMGFGLLIGNAGYLAWRLVTEKIRPSFSLKVLSKLFNLVSFTFLSKAGGVACQHVDLFVVARFLGPETSAVLKLTRTTPELSRALVERSGIAVTPALAHLVGSGDIEKARTVLLRLIRIMLWLLGIMLGGLVAMNDDFVGLWVGGRLFAGQEVSLMICAWFLLAAFTSILGNLCFTLGNIKGSSLAEFIKAVIYIPLIVFGTKYFGLIGCVVAPLIAMAAVTAWYFPLSFSRLLRLLPGQIKTAFRDILIIVAIVVPLTVVFYHIKAESWFSFIGIVAIFSFLYLTALFVLSRDFRIESEMIYNKIYEGIFKAKASQTY